MKHSKVFRPYKKKCEKHQDVLTNGYPNNVPGDILGDTWRPGKYITTNNCRLFKLGDKATRIVTLKGGWMKVVVERRATGSLAFTLFALTGSWGCLQNSRPRN